MPREVADIKKVCFAIPIIVFEMHCFILLTFHCAVHRDLPSEGRFLYVIYPRWSTMAPTPREFDITKGRWFQLSGNVKF